MFETILVTVVGGLLLLFGFRAVSKGDGSGISPKYSQGVSKKDRAAFSKQYGLGQMIGGASCLLAILINCLLSTNAGYYVGIVGIIVGAMLMMRAVKRFSRK